MNDIRNIILIGRTGNGKSTLGNVLVNRGGNFQEVFTEGEFGVSQTHETKVEEF
jgi:shikimate kinase